MKLIYFELKKLFKNKFLYIMLALAVIANVWLVCSEISSKDIKNADSLEKFIVIYNKDSEAMDEYIDKFILAYEKALKATKPHLGIIVTPPESIYTDNDYNFFTKVFIPFRDYVTEYRKTLERALITSQGHIDEYRYIGLNDNSFEIQYQKKVIDSYSKLTDIDFQTNYLKGYDIYLDYSGFGAIAMALLICGAVMLMIPEKVSGALLVVRTSKNGRSKTFLAKAVCAFIYCLFICTLLSLSSFAAIWIKFGFSGGELPIQSVESFRLCPYVITVNQGLLLSFGLRLLSCFAFMTVAFLMSSLFSGYVTSFTFGALFAGLNYIIANYNFLNFYAPLKNLNFLWSINGKEPIRYWRGIKVFGRCLPTFETLIISYLVLSVISLLLGLYLFSGGKSIGGSRIGVGTSNLINKLKGCFYKVRIGKKRMRKSASLCMFELKKLLTPFSVLVIVVALLLSVYLSNESYGINYNHHLKIYNEYMETLKGEWTEEKDTYIREELARLKELEFFAKNVLKCPEGMTYADFLSRVNEGNAAGNKIKTVEELVTLSEYLGTLDKGGVKAEFVYKTAWSLLKDINLSYIYLAAVILLFVNIYACEYREGFSRIQRLSARGRLPVSAYKLMWAFLITVTIVTVCEGYQYFIINKNAGFDNPGASVLNLTMIKSSVDIPIYEFFILSWLKQLVVASAVAAMTALLSKLTKNILPALVAMIFIVYAPAVLEYFGMDVFKNISLLNLMSRV